MPSQSSNFPYDRLNDPYLTAVKPSDDNPHLHMHHHHHHHHSNNNNNNNNSNNNSNNSTSSNSRNRSGSIQTPFTPGIFNTWLSDTIQSPTSPTTTDQLLKGDENHTITSTLASLGLDDNDSTKQLHQSQHQQQQHHMLHTSRSNSSLHSTEWLQQQQQQQQQHTSNYGYTTNSPSSMEMKLRGNNNSNSTVQSTSSQLLRPRATSMSITEDHDNRYSSSLSSGSDSPRMVRPSLWQYNNHRYPQSSSQLYPHPHPPTSHHHHHPSLRMSNSSADLIETMARQRIPISEETQLSISTDKDYLNDSSYDEFSYDTITKLANNDHHSQTPTRSLWIGNLDTSLGLENLITLFSQYGPIENIRLLPERDCAFINFMQMEDAIQAKEIIMNQMNGLIGSSVVRIGFGKLDAQSPSPTMEFGNVQGPTRALWIGNLPTTTTPTTLFTIFSVFGTIESVRILSHRNCGFVNFNSQEDAVRAKKALHSREIMGPGTGAVRIGYAKVLSLKSNGKNQLEDGTLMFTNEGFDNVFIPSVSSTTSNNNNSNNNNNNSNSNNLLDSSYTTLHSNSSSSSQLLNTTANSTSTPGSTTKSLWHSSTPTSSGSGGHSTIPSMDSNMMYYMMNDMISGSASNILAAVASERQYIMQELGEDESDGPLFDTLHVASTYYPTIAPAPELGQHRNVDISRLRDIRKRLGNANTMSVQEIDMIAMECIGDLVELCSDYIGNTIVQRLFEYCSEPTKSMMFDHVAPHIASIGIHKNGTWAAQRIVDTAKLSSQINMVCDYIRPYVPALLLDQFGNYVVQCCLALGPETNQFIFDAIVDNCWEIAQGRFGARAVRATLESPHVTKRQQKYVAATLIQHALLLSTNANGALLLIWLLDTSGISGRYRALGPRLIPHLSKLCTHKLASLTVLKLINQRHEFEARQQILDTIFFSNTDQVLNEILTDQVHGVSLIQKILSSSYVELHERQKMAEKVKQLLAKNKLLHVQGYKRLLEEINMVMVDSNPGSSIATLPGLIMPSSTTATWMNQEWAAIHAHYLSAATAAMQQQQQQMQQQLQQQQQGLHSSPPIAHVNPSSSSTTTATTTETLVLNKDNNVTEDQSMENTITPISQQQTISDTACDEVN
ncbi:hypothetical protein BJ944DRAFT_253246 [Cunninghamella echinulata]|nr:hypothetical protein BJ944DRAFT_253246 [Cunninghamella echinulata]